MTPSKPVSWVVVLVVAWVCVLESSRASARFQAVRETAVGAEDELSFERFRAVFGKAYGSSAAEAEARQHFGVHVASLRDVRARNPLGVFEWQTWFDQPEATVRSRYLGNPEYFAKAVKDRQNAPPERFLESSAYPPEDSAPPSKDWRAEGAVTPVKDQGHCGSCWAFSAVGAIEGQWAIAGYPLTRFSEQMLVSCDDTEWGCSGGMMENAFTWLQSHTHGYIATEASYPYTSGTTQDAGRCKLRYEETEWKGYITGFQMVAASEELLAAYLAKNGPIAIAVDATDFLTYRGGILVNATASRLNHGVLLVGYDNAAPQPYWIIKNSWNTTWGEEGYIRLAKGSNAALMMTHAVAAQLDTDLPPPPKPSPPPPPPPPHAMVLFHHIFEGVFCSGASANERWETNTCLPAPFGESGSMEVQCGSSEMIRRRYPSSMDCTGEVVFDVVTLNTCYPHWGGGEMYDCRRNSADQES